MVFNPEQWCNDLIKELSVDNTVRVIGQKYSVDSELLDCKLVINDGSVPFLVSFSINNKGCVLSPVVRPGFYRDYNKYGPRKYGKRKYGPREVQYYCSLYLAQNLDLKPDIADFRDEIVKIRKVWLSRGKIPKIEQFTQLEQ